MAFGDARGGSKDRNDVGDWEKVGARAIFPKAGLYDKTFRRYSLLVEFKAHRGITGRRHSHLHCLPDVLRRGLLLGQRLNADMYRYKCLSTCGSLRPRTLRCELPVLGCSAMSALQCQVFQIASRAANTVSLSESRLMYSYVPESK